MQRLNKKIRVAISCVAKDRIFENRREHVELTRNADDYAGGWASSLNVPT
jgi:hypothetical protein